MLTLFEVGFKPCIEVLRSRTLHHHIISIFQRSKPSVIKSSVFSAFQKKAKHFALCQAIHRDCPWFNKIVSLKTAKRHVQQYKHFEK